jgi:hypothetical protein
MIRLQLLTGAWPGEVTSMRPCDVADGVYRPREQQIQHHGRGRAILLGPRALEVLKPWLDRPAQPTASRPARQR